MIRQEANKRIIVKKQLLKIKNMKHVNKKKITVLN